MLQSTLSNMLTAGLTASHTASPAGDHGHGWSAGLMSAVLGADPVGHVVDHPAAKFEGLWLWSSTMTGLVIVMLLLIIGGVWVAGHISTGPQSLGNERFITRNPIAHLFEVVCLYLREEIVRPQLHDRTRHYMPFLWTLFFFILMCNLLGLIPLLDLWHLIHPTAKKDHTSLIGGTPTQSIYVTAGLAIIAGLAINIAGIRALGIGGYLKHLTAESPWFVWPIIVPVEILGTLIKPFALAVRLFANMTAGHILLAQVLIFAGLGLELSLKLVSGEGSALGLPILLFSTAGATAVMFLEIFVALLQAFIFMFLTTVFISLLSHHDEEGHHDHEHAEEEEDEVGHAGELAVPIA